MDVYRIHCDLARGSRAHVAGRDKAWEGWSMDIDDLRADPRWGTDVEWMAGGLTRALAAYFHESADLRVIKAQIDEWNVLVDVDVIGEPDDHGCPV